MGVIHIKRLVSSAAIILYTGLALYPAFAFALNYGEARYPELTLLYVLGTAGVAGLIGQCLGARRLLPGIVALLAALAGLWYIFPINIVPAVAIILLTGTYYLIALRRAPLGIIEGYSPNLMAAGVVMHVVAFILAYFLINEKLKAALPVPSALFIIATALYLNRMAVEQAVLAHNKQAPRSVVLGNALLTGTLAATVLLIVNIGALTSLIANASRGLIASIFRLLEYLGGLFQSNGNMDAPPPQSMDGMLPPAEAGEPNLFVTILNIIFLVIGGALAIVLLCFVLRLIYKAVKKIAARLRNAYARFRDSYRTEYTDEQTSLLDGEGLLTSMLDGARDALRRAFKRQPRWADLDNAERVRYAFLRRRRALLKEGVDTAYNTPDQLLDMGYLGGGKSDAKSGGHVDAADFADAYNSVRYGGSGATDAQADNARKLV